MVPVVDIIIIHDPQRSISTQIDAHRPFHRDSNALRQASEHRSDRGGRGHAQHNDWFIESALAYEFLHEVEMLPAHQLHHAA